MSDTATLSRLFASIEADLEQVDNTFQSRAVSGLEILQSATAYVLSMPGKRLRMALTLLSGKMIEYRFDKLLPLGVAFEMAHLATLIHDDIIDSAATRRGIPTVNSRFGNNIAILLGDFFFAKTAGLTAEVEDFRIDRLLADTVATVCEGTILEMLTAHRLDLSLDAYLARIRAKTAALIAACCKGGAIVGNGTDAQIALLEQYGQSLGIAFQIIDDVLDYTGTEATTGKPVGNDLSQGLVTLPLIYALRAERLNDYADRVATILAHPEDHRDDVLEIVHWVTSGSAVRGAVDLAKRYARRARATLSEFGASPMRQVLDELIDYVIERTR